MIQSPTGRVYIGQSWNILQRFQWYKSKKAFQQPYLYNSFMKHGVDSHEFKILHELPIDVSQEVLDRYECIYIDAYRNAGFQLMNLKEGGRGGKHHPDSVEQMRSKLTGRKKPSGFGANVSKIQTGRKHSDERVKNMVEAKKKPIVQISLNDEFVRFWDFATEAAKFLSISNQALTQCLKKGEGYTCAGFKWLYKSDYEAINN